MPYLVLGIAVVIGIILVMRGLRGLDPRRTMVAIRWIVVALVIGGLLIFAIERGVGATLATLAFLLPVILRWRGFARWVRNMGGPSPGQSSDIQTKFLRMSLDHDSGTLDGTVLQGPFRGRRLSELSQGELVSLLGECRVEDDQSAVILEAFLDRVHGAAWRTGDGRAGAGAGGGEGRGSPWSGTAMTAAEAYDILGLKPGASDREIKSAHRKLMLKLHPDQGGSDYLAAKINQAKDILLGGKK